MAYETLIVERHDVVTLVRINRPQQLNALNATVRDEIFGVAAAFDADTFQDRKSTRLNSSHIQKSRMPSSA